MDALDIWKDLVDKQGQMVRALSSRQGATLGSDAETERWEPLTDLFQQGDMVVIEMELAGFDLADIDLSIEEGTLLVQGQRDIPPLSGSTLLRSGRCRGPFRRAFCLPPGLSPEEVLVDLDRGLLRISIPVPDPELSLLSGQES